MNDVFISYRTADDPSAVALLHRELCEYHGADAVFRDADSIEAGEDFDQVIMTAVRQSKVVLAVIGPRWFDEPGGHGFARKVDDPEDYVRRELREAAKNRVPVIPVFTGGIELVKVVDLPDDIAWLAGAQGCVVRPRDERAGVATVLAAVARRVPPPSPRPEPSHAGNSAGVVHAERVGGIFYEKVQNAGDFNINF